MHLVGECQNQTNSKPPAVSVTMLSCSLVPLLARGWQWHRKGWCAGALGGSQLPAHPPCRALLPSTALAQAGLCPYHHTYSSSQAPTKSPGDWTLLIEMASVTAWVTGFSSTTGNNHFRCLTQSPAQRRGMFSIVSEGLSPSRRNKIKGREILVCTTADRLR